LIAWEGEKTLTFTVEDALLSPVSFAMLSGAGLIKAATSDTTSEIHFHQTTNAMLDTEGEINLTDALETTEKICATAPLYIMKLDAHGDITGDIYKNATVDAGGKKITVATGDKPESSTPVMVDYYVIKDANTVSELQIDASNFAGYYYVEADTLFRRQSDGKDLPVNLTFPNVKIQSNFTFSMAPTGDPSTFTFTMDAFPGYTYFDKTKKVLCAMQIVDDAADSETTRTSVFPHKANEHFMIDDEHGYSDSVPDVEPEP
jgi:hypothetical protein